jgi:pimeloyl-ACP methyl ester carboxylesterase
MLGPDSRLLTVLLIVVSVGLLVGVIRFRLLSVKILCGALSIAVAMTGGIAAVNYYYGYYTSWGQLWADFHGNTGNLGHISTASTSAKVQIGHLGWIDLPGKFSGYDRQGLIYLPPQYSEAKYAHVRFPVVELFHGSPGTPLAWNTEFHLTQIMNALLTKHSIGPMVLVMPAIDGKRDYQDCVNGPGVYDETYLTTDVRADILAHYRVSNDYYEWGLSGYSAGGYCAANLALRHPASYGAAAIINGYYLAAGNQAATALNHSPVLENANSPLYTAERLAPDTSPIPAFWVAAGTHDASDYPSARVFAAELDRIEQVPFIKLNAGDTANAWAAALPAALTWLWQQLAPPDLRVLFPVRPQGIPLTIPVPPVKRHYPTSCKPDPLHSGPVAPPCITPTHGQAKLAIGQTSAPA